MPQTNSDCNKTWSVGFKTKNHLRWHLSHFKLTSVYFTEYPQKLRVWTLSEQNSIVQSDKKSQVHTPNELRLQRNLIRWIQDEKSFKMTFVLLQTDFCVFPRIPPKIMDMDFIRTEFCYATAWDFIRTEFCYATAWDTPSRSCTWFPRWF